MDVLMRDIIYSSIKNLFDNQSDILLHTSETGPTEWNLGHHLANELSKYIFWLDHDLDVIKRDYNNKRPDIIFHKRGVNCLNHLVVELKRNIHDNESDINKLKREWMARTLRYRYGVYINIWDKQEYRAVLFTNDGKEYEISPNNKYIKVKRNINSINIINEMVEALQAKELKNERISEDLFYFLDRHILNVYK